jgi:hypothetical protein
VVCIVGRKYPPRTRTGWGGRVVPPHRGPERAVGSSE